MNKRFFILLAILLAIPHFVKAEEDTSSTLSTQNLAVDDDEQFYRNIYVELFGASNLIGIAYDSRIKPGSPFGYRAGISYLQASADNTIIVGPSPLYSSRDKLLGFAIPMEFNCILGKRKSKFEVGIGVSLGIYSTQEITYVNTDLLPIGTNYLTKYHNDFGYFFFSNIGYRYQRKSGFMLRVGVSPSFSFAGRNGLVKTPALYPYLSLGYTFRKL